MSLKPADSTALDRVASRRNVIRGAAWTTAAVTVVVATPNIAAASHGGIPRAATITATRSGTAWSAVTASLGTASGAHQITSGLQVTLTLAAGTASWPKGTGNWTRVGGANESQSKVYTYSGTLAASGTASLGPLGFTNTSNVANITLTAKFDWAGTPAGTATNSVTK